jgi:hypothetical protein
MEAKMHEVLTTDRLTLRPLKTTDAADFARLVNTPAICRMTGTFPYPFPKRSVEGRVQIDVQVDKHITELKRYARGDRPGAPSPAIRHLDNYLVQRALQTVNLDFAVEPWWRIAQNVCPDDHCICILGIRCENPSHINA